MFKKRLEDLKFEDVVSFLSEGRAESINLDYKYEMIAPVKFAALASAYANTAGGYCVFGVQEADERPQPPFVGAALGNDPVQTVKQVLRTQLRPSVEPILSPLLVNPTDPTKAFLVVGIPQSGNAPHATADERVYLKFQDHKEPVLPSLTQYERLLSQRAASKADRDRIANEATEELKGRLQSWPDPLRPGLFADQKRKVVDVDIRVYRSFPDGEDLASPQKMVESIENYRVQFSHGQRLEGLPAHFKQQMNTFSRGVWTTRVSDGIAFATVIHSEGAFVARAAVALDMFEDPGAKSGKSLPYVYVEQLLGISLALVRAAFRALPLFGCYSALTVEVTVTDDTAEDYYIIDPSLPTWVGILRQHLRGPARPRLKYKRELPWGSRAELMRVEREVIHRYVSAFNVPEPGTPDTFVKQTLETIRTDYH